MPSEHAPAGGRLHPATLAFRFAAHARVLLLPAGAVFVLTRGEDWHVWLALLFVPFVVFDVFRYLTLRWRYDEDELVLTEGWIFRSVRHVPYARIQSIDLKQSLVHRLIGVAEVTLETAGGSKPEAVLRVIALAQYEELRGRVLERRAASVATGASTSTSAEGVAASAPAATDDETVLALSTADIVILALNPTRGLAILAIAWELVREYELPRRLPLHPAVERWLEDDSASSIVLVSLVTLGALALFVVLLSVAATLVAYHGYRLEAAGDAFRVRRGLLTRHVMTIPRGRIQVVRVDQSPLFRLLRRARVFVGTAGAEKGDHDERRAGATHFAPIVPLGSVPALLRRIRPDLVLEDARWQPLGRTAPRRILVGHLVRVLPVVGLLAFLAWHLGASHPVSIASVATAASIVGVSMFLARFTARRAAWAREGFGVAWRSGAITHETTVTFPDKVQALLVTENPLDRLNGHVTLSVDTAGTLLGRHIAVRIPYLPRAVAEALRDDLVVAAHRARFRW